MTKKNMITYEGLKALEEELNDLKVVQRKVVAQLIKEAREHGDLAENAEYDAAREEQGKMESRIIELEKYLENVEVYTESELDSSKITIGSTVKLFDVKYNEEFTVKVVGSKEANSLKGLISNECPMGAAILHKSNGEEVEVATPDGPMLIKIVEILK